MQRHLQEHPPPAPFDSSGKDAPKYLSRPFSYNLARRGKIRRPLSVPNPINFYQLASVITPNWSDIETQYNKTNQALSRPVFRPLFPEKNRAFEWEKGFGELARSKVNIRNGRGYILKTDISQFYSSIYTHSIPWAMYTKRLAKKKKNYGDNLGNKIDTLIRNGQDGQTVGIPIGPDTSLLVAEILMSEIDARICKTYENYFRYVDDFEFGCESYNQAEDVLGLLQSILAEYELTLNDSKTSILELPVQINSSWVRELSAFSLCGKKNRQKQEQDLLHYFDLSIRLLKENSDDAIVKYAIKRASAIHIHPDNWSLYQQLLLQWSIMEPGVVPVCVNSLKNHADKGASLDVSKIQETLEFLIIRHSALGHTSELAWAIWGMILFGIIFDKKTVKVLADIENPVIALLSLDAQQQKLIDPSFTFTKWKALMKKEELTGPNWLLAYEAIVKGWLPPVGGKDYLSSADGFSYLKQNNVSFYSVGRTSRNVTTSYGRLYG